MRTGAGLRPGGGSSALPSGESDNGASAPDGGGAGRGDVGRVDVGRGAVARGRTGGGLTDAGGSTATCGGVLSCGTAGAWTCRGKSGSAAI